MDDDIEAAARYQGDVGGFKLALGVGYSRNTDQRVQPPPISFQKNSDYFQAGGYAQHLATGLFIHAAYGSEDNNNEFDLLRPHRARHPSLVSQGRHPPAMEHARPHHSLR